jgi:predicted nucleotidyltransferase
MVVMQRNEAILLFDKFMTRLMKSKYRELVKSLYLFGSLQKGSSEPNDIDLLAVLQTNETVRFERLENTIRQDFLGKLQNIDLLVCNEKEFDKFIGFAFSRNDLCLIWADTNQDPNWQSLIDRTCPVNVNYRKEKAFQYHEFKADYRLKCKFQAAVERHIIKVRELPAEQFYLDTGPWNDEVIMKDESGRFVWKHVDTYEELMDNLDYHKKQGVSSQYLKTLKVLHSYAYRNDICLQEEILYARKLGRPYETFLEANEGTIIFRFYIVDLNQSLYHLNYSQSIDQVILIPRYKVQSKNNYLYEIMRGERWSPENLRLLDDIYHKA